MSSDPDSYAAIFDRAAATYEAVGVPFFDVFGPRLVELARLQTGEDVLDLGTGRGAALFPAATAVGPSGSATGLDLAPGMVQRTAADAAARDWRHVRVLRGDAAHPPVEEASYDAVLAAFVLFFLNDPAAALQCWARLLRPGGRLGLATFLSHPDDDLFAALLRELAEAPDEPPAPPSARRASSWPVTRPGWTERWPVPGSPPSRSTSCATPSSSRAPSSGGAGACRTGSVAPSSAFPRGGGRRRWRPRRARWREGAARTGRSAWTSGCASPSRADVRLLAPEVGVLSGLGIEGDVDALARTPLGLLGEASQDAQVSLGRVAGERARPQP